MSGLVIVSTTFFVFSAVALASGDSRKEDVVEEVVEVLDEEL